MKRGWLALSAGLLAFASVASAGEPAIFGRVLLSDAPADLSGSTVRATPGDATATTDSTGAYVLTVPAGTYEVEASRPGYRPASVPGVVVGADVELDFRLQRVFVLTVRVELRGATVGFAGTQLTLSGPEGNRFATTDALGAARFEDLVPGAYEVFASRECFRPGSLAITLAQDRTETLALDAVRFAVRGTVTLQGETGDMSGTEVRLEKSGTTVASTETDPVGRFAFEGVCAGAYEMIASRTGFVPASLLFALSAPLDLGRIELERLGPFTLSGTVRVIGGDAAGVEVGLLELEGASSVTGRDGAYRIEGIPFGTYTVLATKAGFAPARVPGLRIRSDAKLDLQLFPMLPPRSESAGCTQGPGAGTLAAAALGMALLALRRRRRPTRSGPPTRAGSGRAP